MNLADRIKSLRRQVSSVSLANVLVKAEDSYLKSNFLKANLLVTIIERQLMRESSNMYHTGRFDKGRYIDWKI